MTVGAYMEDLVGGGTTDEGVPGTEVAPQDDGMGPSEGSRGEKESDVDVVKLVTALKGLKARADGWATQLKFSLISRNSDALQQTIARRSGADRPMDFPLDSHRGLNVHPIY